MGEFRSSWSSVCQKLQVCDQARVSYLFPCEDEGEDEGEDEVEELNQRTCAAHLVRIGSIRS